MCQWNPSLPLQQKKPLLLYIPQACGHVGPTWPPRGSGAVEKKDTRGSQPSLTASLTGHIQKPTAVRSILRLAPASPTWFDSPHWSLLNILVVDTVSKVSMYRNIELSMYSIVFFYISIYRMFDISKFRYIVGTYISRTCFAFHLPASLCFSCRHWTKASTVLKISESYQIVVFK